MIKKDAVAYDDFVVLDEDNNPVTGLSSFTKILYDPDKNEVSGSITVTVEELGDGLYRTSFTPNKLGYWSLIIFNSSYFPWGKGNSYKCSDNLLDDVPWAVWDEQTTDHEISDSTGVALTDNIPVSQGAIINEDTLDSESVALGIVVDNEGVPVANARVGAWNLEAGENGVIQFETNSEMDGTFRLKVLKGDTYYVSVLEPYYGWKNREVIVA